ncbi:MAG: type II toxin-antitoxin system VapC family toxin [Alphaproteobacteria bacterium]|nr:type II toxin-antitoxin system VapC family toxin [Alphaproteobacteria bacterium]
MLLDTHIWLWALLDPARLSRAVRVLLASPTETLRLSPISVWEAVMLAERGRIALEPDPRSWLDRALAAAPVVEAPLTFEVAMASRSIALEHRDPADRFIAASALVFGLTLVTADARLLDCPDIEVLANR